MFSNAGSVRGMLDRKAKSKNKKRSDEFTEDTTSILPNTPGDHSNVEMSNYTVTANSTPLSTFERPTTPVPHWPLPALKNGSTRVMPPTINANKEVRPSASKASLSGCDAQPRSPRLTSGYPTTGRFLATPSFPPAWTIVHDRAICVLDACDYSLVATIKKLRSAFPELSGSILTPVMVDKRLRTLDQNPDIDFFRIGLEHLLLAREEDEDVSPASRVKLEKRAARCDSSELAQSMPSFSGMSTGRQNSINASLHEISFKTTPDLDRSTASSGGSKIPRVAKTQSVVRSYPFGSGYLSYRTIAAEEKKPRYEGMHSMGSV